MSELHTTVYYILSCPYNLFFFKRFIQLTPQENLIITKEELIEIKVNNKMKIQVKEFNNAFEGKNIYLYKAELNLKKEEMTIKIQLSYLNDKLISKDYKIHKNQQLFIYFESFKYESILDCYKYLKTNDFIEKKYKLFSIQKFMIFHTYLSQTNEKVIPFLLSETSRVIIELDEIDFEFLIVYLLNLFASDNNDVMLPQINSKEILKSILLNFGKKKKIYVKKYNDNNYNKIINQIESYRQDFIEKDLSLHLDLFLLTFYQLKDEKKFNEIFRKTQSKNEVIQFILKHKKTFSNLQSSNIQLLFENIENKDKDKYFSELISLSPNFNEYVKFFCSKKNFIPRKFYIKREECPLPDENTDITLLVQFVEILMEKDLFFPENHFVVLIEKLEMKDFKKIFYLKDIFKKYNNRKTRRIIEKLNLAFHNTGKDFIKKNKLNNLDIITFIQEDALIFYKDYENNYEFACLISYVNLDTIDNQFCKKFNARVYDYEQLFKKHYSLFLDSIIQKAKNFKHLKILFQIFDIQNNLKPKKIIEQLIQVYYNNNLDKTSVSSLEVNMIIGTLFKLVSDNQNYELDKLIRGTKNYFSQIETNKVFVSILNNFGNELNPYIIDKLIQNISNNTEDLSNNDIIIILKNFTNQKMQKYFLEKQKNKIIKEEEIFNKELSDNLKLLSELIDMEFFNKESFKDVKYINVSRLIMNNTKENLIHLNFSLQQLKVMYNLDKNNDNDNNLKKRFSIICLGEKLDIENLYQSLIEKIKYCMEVFEKIEEIINIFSNYYPNEKSAITHEFRIKRDEILNNTIKDFPNIKQIKNFDNLYSKAHEISKLKNSKFFIEIFQKNRTDEKNDNDSLILNKTKKLFSDLKNLFNLETENNVDLCFLEKIISAIKNHEIEKEINILINHFQINENLNENLCEKLKLLNNKKKEIEKLNKIVLLLKDFNLNDKNVQENLEEFIKQLKNNPSLEELNQININLNDLNLNILNPQLNSEALAVIDKMYENPELIKFIINKNIIDIHQMGEFIDDSEDVYITTSDIAQLENCMKFIQELKQNMNSEKEFLNKFISVVKRKNYKDIGIKFENSAGKYHDFYELYTNHLNPNELNKEHIKTIYMSSIFNLIYSYPEYKCNVQYKNNGKKVTKDFDEILDLRDIALLRKKDQKEERYFKICEDFANNINDIQEILEILRIIASKGYFEEINYKIQIKKGIATGFQNNDLKSKNEKKSLKEIIEELNYIKELQNNEVKSIYLLNPISRLVYGRQFNYLYKIITDHENYQIQTFEKVSNIILKYVTNNNKKIKLSI